MSGPARSFRTRLAAALAALSLAPLLVFGLGVRARVRSDLTGRYRQETRDLAADIRTELARDGHDVRSRLAAMAEAAELDNRLRRALADRSGVDRGYLLDYAGRAMRLAGLAVLQLQEADGRILSSGHFRNEYDRREPGVAERISAAAGGEALVRAPTPSGPVLALAAEADVRVATRPLTLVGGVAVDSAFLAGLAPGGAVRLVLDVPGDAASPPSVGPPTGPGAERAAGGPAASGDPEDADAVVEEVTLPFVDFTLAGRGPEGSAAAGRVAPGAAAGAADVARLSVVRSLAPLRSLRRQIDLWFLAALLVVAAAALLFGLWAATRLSRPLADLARRTARLDLERLEVSFPTGRRDEIGVLARGLEALTGRIRAGAVRLRDAERRATLGEIARQVNHDVRNGLTPLRHVVRHLSEVAREHPSRLAEVFEERRGSLEGGLGYLETLATRYARLSSRPASRPCDVAALARRVAADAAGAAAERGGDVRADTDEAAPPALADPVAVRRILENLVRNAIESMDGEGGEVVVRVGSSPDPGRVRLEVADTGPGMDQDQRSRVFEEFYTTREEGAGLGLAIVRRLVTDMEGTIEVESRPGEGARFTIDLPAVEEDA